MRRVCSFLMIAVLGVLWTSAAARPDEEKVALDKLPKAVADAVKKRFPKAEMTEAAKETENDKTVFEVTVKDAGKTIDVTLTPEGTILGLEKEIAAKDLPKAVTESIDAKYPKASYKYAEEVIKVKDGQEKLEYYEVRLVTADCKMLEVVVAPNGKITKVEDQTKKKSD
ncbi:MAG: PepSY-like domain-containing protein [Planctomycetes bacterium]|nr:PepSY-like domain-containing protein [Planctomycetota bacterium]